MQLYDTLLNLDVEVGPPPSAAVFAHVDAHGQVKLMWTLPTTSWVKWVFFLVRYFPLAIQV